MLRGMAKKKPSVTLVGSGSLASALAKLLPGAGYKVDEIVVRPQSPRRRSAASLARACNTKLVTAETASWRSEIVWLAVGDSAIASCASSLAPFTNWKGRVVLHSSGALSSKELASLERRGAHVASAHPMMTFVPGTVPRVSGVVWTLEGDAKAVTEARRIVNSLGGVSLKVERKNKPLYHAFGAFLSPLLVVYLESTSEIALASGITRRDLAAVMRPIIEQTLSNLFPTLAKKGESGKAFSGPLIRGDVATIERHLRSLRRLPNVRRLYEALVLAALHSTLPIGKKEAIRRTITKSV